MTFTWNHEKNNDNIKHHHLSFELASRVFLDPNRIEFHDKRHSINEERYITIGLISDKLVSVIYTPLPDDCARIITAWKATKTQAKYYYDCWRSLG